jgi:SPP1 gp7 family putative phage head morphogenesis protein
MRFPTLFSQLNPFGGRNKAAKQKSIMANTYAQQVHRHRQDVGKWRAALDRAEGVYFPDRTALLNIYADLVLDNHLSSVLETRLINVLSKPFKLQNAAGDENIELTKLLKKPWFRKFCTYALESIFYGHSLIEFPVPVAGHFPGCELVPRQYVSPELGIVRSMPGQITGTEFRDNPDFSPWLIEVGELTNLGLLNKAAPMALYKKNVVSAWADFTEIFGMPYRAVKTEAEGDELQRIEEIIADMGQASYGVFPEDVKIDFISPATGNVALYDTFVERANSELSKLVLGQTMTTDSGSSRSQGEVHERVAASYTRADAEFLASLINEQLLPFMVQHGYKVAGLEFVYDESEQLPKLDQFKIAEGLLKAGLKVKRTWLESTFGVELEDEPTAAAEAVAGAVPGAEVKVPQILGYHIENGVASRNEARAPLGLPAEDDSKDKARAELKAQLAIVGAATAAGVPLEAALLLASLKIELPPAAESAADEPGPDEPGGAPGAGGGAPGKPKGSPAAPVGPNSAADLQALYGSTSCCTTLHQATAAAAPVGDEAELASLWDRLVNVIYAGGGEELLLDLPLFEYIEQALQGAVNIAWNATDPGLKKALYKNVQRFSGFKSHKVCRQLTRALVDADGKILDFAAFKAEADKINTLYNVAYLKTEYEQAVAAAQMASKWADFEPTGLLQYRTVGDDLVRPEHRKFDGVTLPASHSFWATHYPPNDWNCRCDTVEMVDDELPHTPAEQLAGLPDVPALFAHNVGASGEIFGKEHPYFEVPAATAKAIDKQLKLNL